jgi:hypothetical protein
MKVRSALCRLACAALVVGVASNAEARTLAKQVNSFFGPGGLALNVKSADPTLVRSASPFSSSTLTTLGLLIQQFVPRAADFPAISTVPGLTFRYNAELELFERSSASLGPVFVEQAQTLGRGKLEGGFSYLFIDFDELNGSALDRIGFAAQHHPDPILGDNTISLQFDKFTLQSHVISLFSTYGVTDRWDINILLPVVYTYWSMRSRAHINNENGPVYFFDDGLQITERTFSAADDKVGLGDLQLRTKYHFLSYGGFNLASGFALRVTTGEVENFQGIGDTTLTSSFIISQEYGRFHAHASSGIEYNLDDSDRSRVRYAGGLTFQIIEQLVLLVDVIGSANLKTDRISVNVPEFNNDVPDGSPPLPSGYTHISLPLNVDIVDLVVGFKAQPVKSVIGFFAVFLPLNDEGLRSELIPTFGLEFAF